MLQVCESGHTEVFEVLVAHPNIRLDDTDRYGRTAMVIASEQMFKDHDHNKGQVVADNLPGFLSRGISNEDPDPHETSDDPMVDNFVYIVTRFLELGLDINFGNGMMLKKACSRENLSVVQFLVSKNASTAGALATLHSIGTKKGPIVDFLKLHGVVESDTA